jgi:hypothetical protein
MLALRPTAPPDLDYVLGLEADPENARFIRPARRGAAAWSCGGSSSGRRAAGSARGRCASCWIARSRASAPAACGWTSSSRTSRPRRERAGPRHWSAGEDWAVLAESEEDAERRRLTRRIVTFREVGGLYRRGEVVHTQRLYPAAEILEALRATGFTARCEDGLFIATRASEGPAPPAT